MTRVDHHRRALRVLQLASWTLFATSLFVYLFTAALNFLSGCPPEENQSSATLGQPALFPPGVTCSYDVVGGTLTTGDEWWPPVLILASLVNAIVLTGSLSDGRSPAQL